MKSKKHAMTHMGSGPKNYWSWRWLIRGTPRVLNPKITVGGKQKNIIEPVIDDQTKGNKRGKWEERVRDAMDTSEFDRSTVDDIILPTLLGSIAVKKQADRVQWNS